jgi:hypothetical protein
MTQHTYGKLKLMSLTIKKSSKGTDYLQGYLGNLSEGFKGRVATYIERIQFRREAPWTRSVRTARVSI